MLYSTMRHPARRRSAPPLPNQHAQNGHRWACPDDRSRRRRMVWNRRRGCCR